MEGKYLLHAYVGIESRYNYMMKRQMRWRVK